MITEIITTHHLAGEVVHLKGLQIVLEPYAVNIVFFWWGIFFLVCLFLVATLVREYLEWRKDEKIAGDK